MWGSAAPGGVARLNQLHEEMQKLLAPRNKPSESGPAIGCGTRRILTGGIRRRTMPTPAGRCHH